MCTFMTSRHATMNDLSEDTCMFLIGEVCGDVAAVRGLAMGMFLSPEPSVEAKSFSDRNTLSVDSRAKDYSVVLKF